MGWLEGLLTGYADTLGEMRRENAKQAELAASREGDVFKTLLNSDNPEIRGMAATGLLANTQPKKVKGNFGGWMGEMQANPMYPQLMKYINTPQKTMESVTTTVPGSPARQTQGFLTPDSVPGQEPTLKQPTTSPTEAEPMAQPQPLPGSLTPPPAPPPSLGTPVVRAPEPGYDNEPPPSLQAVHDYEEAQSLPSPPPVPDWMPSSPGAPGSPPPIPTPNLQTKDVPATPSTQVTGQRETYQLPKVFQTEGERAISLRRAQGTGDFEALTDVARRSGQPNPEKWAADLIASGYSRAGAGIHEGDARQLPDGSWVQDLYDNTGRIVGQIPAGPKGAGRSLTKREEIAAGMFGAKYGEGGNIDPASIMRRLTPNEHMDVLREEGILGAEARLRQAELMANAPLAAQAKSDLIEKLNTKWQTLQKPQRVMAQALNEMQVGVNRLEADPIGASQAVLITFQKILDPTSVVRESEYARSAEGLPLLSRIQGMFERLQSGGAGVPKEELAQMAETARQFLVGMQHFNDGERQRIEDRAAQNQIDPGYIFGGGVAAPPPRPQLGAPATPQLGAPPAPPGTAAPAAPTGPAAVGAGGGKAVVGKNAKGQTTITIQ